MDQYRLFLISECLNDNINMEDYAGTLVLMSIMIIETTDEATLLVYGKSARNSSIPTPTNNVIWIKVAVNAIVYDIY